MRQTSTLIFVPLFPSSTFGGMTKNAKWRGPAPASTPRSIRNASPRGNAPSYASRCLIVMVHADGRDMQALRAPREEQVAENDFRRRRRDVFHQGLVLRPLHQRKRAGIDISLGDLNRGGFLHRRPRRRASMQIGEAAVCISQGGNELFVWPPIGIEQAEVIVLMVSGRPPLGSS